MTRLSDCIAAPFFPVHMDIKAGLHREYWLYGGRGSAKSSFVSLEILLGMLRDPDANAIIYRKVGATLRESVYEQMLWAIARLGLSAYFRPKLSPPEIVFTATGQRILFRGADDPAKSKSIKLSKGHFGFLWFEELSEFTSMQDVRTIKAGVVRGGRAVTFYTYNPPMTRSAWVNAEALVPREDRLTHLSTYRDVPPAWLGADFLNDAAQLARTNPRLYRWMYLGEVTGRGGAVFENLDLRPLSPAEADAARVYCGLDFGFAADPDALVRAAYDPRTKKLWLLDEFVGVRTPSDTLAREILRRCGDDLVRCDSAEPRMVDTLRRAGVHAVAVRKGAGSVRVGVRWLQECSAIVIDPARCPNAAREFSAYEYLPDAHGGFLCDIPDRDNHTIDALRYALEDVIRARTAYTL